MCDLATPMMLHVKHHLGWTENARHAGRMFHVKHETTRPPSEQEIESALRDVGIVPTRRQLALLARHAEMVLVANRYFNLTRITAPEEFVRLHIVDSLLPWLYVQPSTPCVDLGSGAGFPGIPLAIVHGMTTALCESVGKKAAFLESCVKKLGIACTVVHGRAEELGATRPRAQLVVARAVASLPALVELASPLLDTGGRLIALKGDPEVTEIERGDAVASNCGMQRTETVSYVLPGGVERRTLVSYARTGETRIRLPRRVGLAQRQPLA